MVRGQNIINYFLIIIFSLLVSTLPPRDGTDEGDVMTLSIEDVQRIAIQENADLRISKNDMDSAILYKESVAGMFYPEISAFGEYTYLNPPPGIKRDLLPGIPLELSMAGRENYSYGLQIRYLLFAGGRRLDAMNAAKLNVQAAELLHNDSRRKAIYDARKAFFLVLFSREAVRLAEEGYKRARERMQNARDRFERGAISKLAYLRAETEEAESGITLQKVKDRYEASVDSLKLILNLPVSQKVEPLGDLRGYAEKIDNHRSDTEINISEVDMVKAARLKADQAKLAAEIKKSELYPTIIAGLRLERIKPYLAQNEYGNDASFRVSAIIPIYDGGIDVNEYRIAEKNAENASVRVEEAEKKLETYYKILLEQERRIRDEISVRRSALNTASQALDAAGVAWRNGAISHSELMDSELAYFHMEVAYLSAIREILICAAEQEKITGRKSDLFLLEQKSSAKEGEQ